MKKLMITLVAIALAGVTQAATYNWKSDVAAYGVNAAGVTDNGDYAAGNGKAFVNPENKREG